MKFEKAFCLWEWCWLSYAQ